MKGELVKWEAKQTTAKDCVRLASSKGSLTFECQEGVWAWVEENLCACEELHIRHIPLSFKDHSKQEPTSKLSNQDGCFGGEGTCLLGCSLSGRKQSNACTIL